MDCRPALVADAAAYGVDVNEHDPLAGVPDDNLLCFVRWCRANSIVLTSDPILVRRVFAVYCGPR